MDVLDGAGDDLTDHEKKQYTGEKHAQEHDCDEKEHAVHEVVVEYIPVVGDEQGERTYAGSDEEQRGGQNDDLDGKFPDQSFLAHTPLLTILEKNFLLLPSDAPGNKWAPDFTVIIPRIRCPILAMCCF